ncbi:MAG: hydantoinase/oxoprolinase family protein [Actinomycetia bacterium]|nr:hydantoinase/oxoprolinase family protein [Actinomycetes bacterium]
MTAPDGYSIGVDIGGTFTDCLVVARDGTTTVGKVSSTPSDLSVGFFGSIAAAAEQIGLDERSLLSATTKLAHGTTAGINAIVTGTGAKVLLLTTKGHADSIRAMAGQGRVLGATIEEILDYSISSRPDPVVPRERVCEITERIDFAGDVIVAMSDDDIGRSLDRIDELGVDAVAISFLWSFVNPSHEQRARERVAQRFPNLFVSCSHDVAPRIGEYGRTVSTVMNAAIGPLMVAYIDRIVQGAADRGLAGEVLFGLCEGGLVPAEEARRHPLGTVQSGPVAGVVGSALFARAMGYENIIVTDMGGTTLDVATIANGEVSFSEENELERQRVYLRKVDVESIGAGGGSIAWVHEDSGTLRVGPRSAGAVPGPICYGRGGSEVTVTDADLVLGVLNPDRPLAGGLTLDVDAAQRGVSELAARLGMSTLECAAGIVEIVDSRMEDLIRRVTIQRGQDPRGFTLWAYGGASGAHAGLYGRDIGAPEVVFPLGDAASVWSAYGLVSLQQSRSFQANALLRTPFDLERVSGLLHDLELQARKYADARAMRDIELVWRGDMKYSLQVFEVETELPDGDVDERWAAELMANFQRNYEGRFGRGSGYAEAGAVLTALRVTVRSPATDPVLRPERAADGPPAPESTRDVYWSETRAAEPTPIYWGPTLLAGVVIDGPAIAEYPNTTIAVRPGQSLRRDDFGNLILKLKGDA